MFTLYFLFFFLFLSRGGAGGSFSCVPALLKLCLILKFSGWIRPFLTEWIKEYHDRRPGLKVLQQKIDDFIAAHEEQEEQVTLGVHMLWALF